ncbi:TPA: hypothetical protein ACH3X2_011078 [Trebouxia sp. C0005]
MGPGLFARCFGATKTVGEAEANCDVATTQSETPAVGLQMGDVVKWTSADVQRWLSAVGSGEHAYNFEGMTGQDLLELTDAEIMARVTARKPAAKLAKAVQHLQRTWLQVTPTGPQPLSSSTDSTKVTILRGTASGVINVPIDTAKPSDSIKASWGPSVDTPTPEAHLSQFERNASVPIPTPLEADLAAERAVTQALAREMFDFGTVIDNPLAGSKSLGGSTNTSPGAGGPGHTATMARSASMALAAQAAAAASLRRHTPLTPVSPPSPSHTTHDYTPGSFTYSRSMSATPEALMNRRAELDGTEALSAGAGMPQASASHQQAAAHEQQQSFIPESQAPAYVVDVSAEEPATAEEASNVEVDTASATIDSTAAEQSSQQQQSAHLSPERQHDQHKGWQLPGLTGSDAIQPEEWQKFCTKVEQPLPSEDPLPSNADVLQNRADLAEDQNRDDSDVAAAERAYVKSLVKRFEKSVGPNWPARQPINAIGEDTGKENTEAGQGQYLVFTPVPDQPQV